MKHIKLFEGFAEDQSAVDKILSVANADWFISGEDAPEEFRSQLANFQSDDEFLSNAVQLSTEGPGYTDMWLSRGELISDILMDGEADEDEIEADNRAWFAEERAQMIQELQNRFQMPFSVV